MQTNRYTIFLFYYLMLFPFNLHLQPPTEIKGQACRLQAQELSCTYLIYKITNSELSPLSPAPSGSPSMLPLPYSSLPPFLLMMPVLFVPVVRSSFLQHILPSVFHISTQPSLFLFFHLPLLLLSSPSARFYLLQPSSGLLLALPPLVFLSLNPLPFDSFPSPKFTHTQPFLNLLPSHSTPQPIRPSAHHPPSPLPIFRSLTYSLCSNHSLLSSFLSSHQPFPSQPFLPSTIPPLNHSPPQPFLS